MIRGEVYQGDITILNASNERASKYIKQKINRTARRNKQIQL